MQAAEELLAFPSPNTNQCKLLAVLLALFALHGILITLPDELWGAQSVSFPPRGGLDRGGFLDEEDDGAEALAHRSPAGGGTATSSPPDGRLCTASDSICMHKDGRLGNALYMLERSLWLTSTSWKSICYFSIDPRYVGIMSQLLRVPEDGVIRLRPDAPRLTRNETWGNCSLHCYKYHCLYNKAVTYPLPNVMRQIMQASILPMARCDPSFRIDGEASTLVMQMRGGDALYATYASEGWYAQPPCAYWLAVFGSGNGGKRFQRALIVTEPGWKEHPCIGALKKTFGKKRFKVQSSNVTQDACTVAAALHLAISFGTFGTSMSQLNTRLASLHVPFGEDNVTSDEYGGRSLKGRHWYREEAVFEGGMPYAQRVYSFPGFDANNTNRETRVTALLAYPLQRVIARTIPATAP